MEDLSGESSALTHPIKSDKEFMDSGSSVVHIGQLFALQELDTKADGVRTALESVTDRLDNDESLAPLRESVAAMEEERRPLIARLRDMETVVEDGRRHIEAEEGKLYGGTVRSPRDLEDLQHEVESLKSAHQAREDELLNVLGAVEELDGRLSAEKKDLVSAEAEWARDQEGLRVEHERLSRELAKLEQQRQPFVDHLSLDVRHLYDQLRKTRAGRAVVRVERGTCQGCRISLPMNVVQRARSGAAIVQCSSCGRILFAS